MEKKKNKNTATAPSQSVGEPRYTVLSLIDQATVMYNAHGLDFIELLDHYLNCPPDAKRYVFCGPRYFILVEEIDYADPCDPSSEKVEPYWHVAWQHCLDGFAKTLFEIAPYKLDKVCFMRNKQGFLSEFKFHSWNKLERICRYGLKTKKTTSPSSPPTPSSSADSTT